ncbi:MAG: hydroxyacylglutathione hydrolase [Pseudoalteromonas tetraodonis]|jgi:hydroxyacylglutathione hydrolase
MTSKTTFLICSLLLSATANASELNPPSDYRDINAIAWMHGAKSCKEDQNPAIQVVQAAGSSYILRQNKCVTYEAPFIYVLFGQNTALVVDTGANELASESPIFDTVKSLYEKQKSTESPNLEKILVVHSHSHSDHTKGDSQFDGYDYIEVVGTNSRSLEQQLGLLDWPKLNSSIDLGGRIITIIPTPGHQEQSISIYDDQTQWLLTGDSLYPGVIRVKNWDDYRNSISRLSEFSKHNPVSYILGAHIEMNRVTKKPYKIGETYQPDEHPLSLPVSDLEGLNEKLKLNAKSKKLRSGSLVISPLSRFEKLIIKAVTLSRKSD